MSFVGQVKVDGFICSQELLKLCFYCFLSFFYLSIFKIILFPNCSFVFHFSMVIVFIWNCYLAFIGEQKEFFCLLTLYLYFFFNCVINVFFFFNFTLCLSLIYNFGAYYDMIFLLTKILCLTQELWFGWKWFFITFQIKLTDLWQHTYFIKVLLQLYSLQKHCF